MSKNHISNEKIEFNKHQSEIKKQSQFKCCFWGEQHKDCSDDIISAHSIQRGKILDSIAEEGMVSYLTADPSNDLSEISPTFELEGIRKFSTFYGFCGKHDKEVFQPIEDKSFEGTEEQLNLYAYRAISKELYAQEISLRKNKLLLGDVINENCPPHYLLTYPSILSGNIVVPEYIKEDIKQKVQEESIRQRIKNIEQNIKGLSLLEGYLKNVIKNQESSLIKHQTYIFDYDIPIACSGVFFLYIGPSGESILNQSETVMEAITVDNCKNTILNVFPENGKTYVIFSTIKTNDKVINFVNNLLSDNDNINWKLSHVILNHIENIAFRPSYIDTFSDKETRSTLFQVSFSNALCSI
ncbi:hypothetical protein [Actinobacillus minor]|uniref:hypothetical protein n=1 Tax=Actinobacillus minor TaxID=51047 RepID=UPI0026F2C576|nr:hypothetical protein [Actinobacillus minor]